ncbi:MAG: CDGSH iron-sulfur domain-containing protein [Terriglobales bacterium]
MADVKITVKTNGPYRIEGAVKLVDLEGKEWDVSAKPAFSLCRCGHSANKPFCDGTHKTINFVAEDTAPKQAAAPPTPAASASSS